MDKKVALVTGASGAIGKEIALFLTQRNIFVIGSYFSNNKYINQVLNENIYWIKLDLSNEKSIKDCIDEIHRKFGRLDFLVNNAGIKKDGLIENLSYEDIKDIIDLNLTGTILLTKYCLPLIKESKGRIVNISSVSGVIGNIGQTNYSASKSGIIGFTKSLSKELGRYGVSVNSVSPGLINSEMIESIPEKIKEKFISQISLGRFGNPQGVAELIYFLLTNEENYITGQNIVIDGGI